MVVSHDIILVYQRLWQKTLGETIPFGTFPIHRMILHRTFRRLFSVGFAANRLGLDFSPVGDDFDVWPILETQIFDRTGSFS